MPTEEADNKQILIGPGPKPKNQKYKYKVVYRYYDLDGSTINGSVETSEVEYTGTQTITADIKKDYNGNKYTIRGSGKIKLGNGLPSSIYSNGYTTRTFSGENCTVIFDYIRERKPSTINIKHKWIKSDGNSYYGTESNITVLSNSYNGVDLWQKDFYDSYSKSNNNIIVERAGDGYYVNINNIPEGANIEIELLYKSKKINLIYKKITEKGSDFNYVESTIQDKENVGKEVYIKTTVTFAVDDTFKNHSYMGTETPTETVNWNTKSFTSDEKECKVYNYISYYEKRNLHKYVKIPEGYGYLNPSIAYIKRKNKNNEEEKEYVASTEYNNDTLAFGSKCIINSDGLSKKIYYSGRKYVYDNNNYYSIGVARTSYSNNKWNNRYNSAISSANNAPKYTYNIKKHRTIEGLSGIHSQTIVANFYYELENPVSVYVRHILKNKDGSYTVSTGNDISFLKNDTEIYRDSTDTSNNNGWKVIYNGYNQRKYHSNEYNYNDSIPNGYSEYFVIDKADNLKLEKSKTVLYDGEEYKVIGYKKYSGAVQIKQSTGCRTYYSPVSISGYSAGKKVYVDFYYEKTDYSNDDPPPTPEPPEDPNAKYKNLRGKAAPSLLFNPENGSGESLESIDNKVAYVPATEYIRPYFETASFIPYDLIYKISDVDGSGNPKYELTTYNAYQLISSDVVNKSDLNNEALMLGTESKSVITTSEGSIGVGFNGISTPNKNDYLSNPKKMISSIKIGEKTSINNYKDVQNSKKVESNKYNGLRKGDGTVTYKLTKIVGEKPTYNKTATINVVNAMDVNVFTPMQVDDADVKSTGSFVNHSNIDGNSVIQKDTEFTVTPKIKEDFTLGYNHLSDRYNYLKGYYIIFAFDVEINGQNNPAYCPVWVDKGGSLTAIPHDFEGETSVKQLQEKIYTIAVTINTPDIVKNVLEKNRNSFNEGIANEIKSILNNSSELSLIDINKNGRQTDESKNPYQLYLQNYKAVSKYFVKNTTATYVLARLYDFKITDCYDVNYKNVFRKFDNENGTVNGLTNICFYSGKNKLLISEGNNIIYSRAENTILPLGPYKHTQKDYTKAPKLGYRISFDVKTYGYYNYSDSNEAPKRRIQITPKYYYISKDGQIYKENIKLYYKNSSGKYITFNDSNYNIAFTPNDGYRSQYNNGDTPDSTNLSTKKVNLSIGKIFTLEPKTMMTTSNDKFIQAWYGEYKVPNSTIIVEENNGKVDLNNPLTDGYLGVIFKIECIDEGEGKKITILYDQDDKAAQGGNHNTSEWDYEGYLGCVSGKNFSGSLQLEKGKWEINDDLYQKIKGTVVLYDIDDRAANDFD